MNSRSINLILAFTAALILNNPAHSQSVQQENQPKPDSLFFKTLLSKYIQSIDQADTVLASKIWSHTAEVSFINPGGTEYGWSGVKNVYKMFRDNFSARKLSFYNLKYSYYGDVSWLQFYWIFDSTVKGIDKPVQTKGRETQIWRKLNGEWRLVHVHYSGMPVTSK
jgi:hypothetical protein